MDVKNLSTKYEVRKLEEADIDRIYEVSAGNPMFYEYCPPYVTRDSILRDMRALPPGTTCDDKFYVGYFQGGDLAAVLDLILNYPDRETAFVGLFMMNKDFQGKGEGSFIVGECFARLKEMGYRFVRLGFARGNPQSEAFWVKNGFARTGVESDQGNYVAVVMQRKLHTEGAEAE